MDGASGFVSAEAFQFCKGGFILVVKNLKLLL
ncbi:hypothetical protein MY4824_008235 [Beauveria thailandica]